ncbi:uncharacterized protein LOC132296291 [Cornus florida]|uniref:uncharacterized protein LOC132296291 n=1 Tax=Cornus florida TaxID=4283 RepID=UPI00289BAAEA|nr:uncharacterized protein LOC132296291 [Cornus florida]
MSLPIPGPKSPGKEIDVYLRPLINELKELWADGVITYDATTKRTFRLHASVLWTMNDFPAYGDLSGWVTKGYMACPICNVDKCSMRLENGKKICYMCHRRWLPPEHRWRNWYKQFDGKTKDNVKTRLDLQSMGIRKELHLISRSNKFFMPPACYTLSKEKKISICEWLKAVKLPDGYGSNISRCVNTKNCTISGLKSHDCHILLQRLLPVVIRGNISDKVSNALVELGLFFKELCSVHLPREAILGGPTQYRWMYPIERFLHTLKSYVRNKARPEGSIAEAYIDNECVTFCSMYLQGARHYEMIGSADLKKAHFYVLNNCTEVEPFLREHKEDQSQDPNHVMEFTEWLKDCVVVCTDDLFSLACGPDSRVNRYIGCIVNGIRFHTKDREKNRKTQNNGVIVKGEDIDFYGCLTDIIELSYDKKRQLFLFNCDWFDVRAGIHKDQYFTSVNLSRKAYNDDPFVLADQANQVLNLKDNKLKGQWEVVQQINPRNTYDVLEKDKDGLNERESSEEVAYQDFESLEVNGVV